MATSIARLPTPEEEEPELVSKMVLSQPEEKKEGYKAEEARQTKGVLAI